MIVNEGNDVFLVGSQTKSEIMLSEDGGALDGINCLLQIFGGSSSVKSDQLRVYDDGAVANKLGNLEDNEITGFNMQEGIKYNEIETLTLRLGDKDDDLLIRSTISGNTNIYAGASTQGHNKHSCDRWSDDSFRTRWQGCD